MWLTRLAFWYLPNPPFTRCLGGFGPKLDPSLRGGFLRSGCTDDLKFSTHSSRNPGPIHLGTGPDGLPWAGMSTRQCRRPCPGAVPGRSRSELDDLFEISPRRQEASGP